MLSLPTSNAKSSAIWEFVAHEILADKHIINIPI